MCDFGISGELVNSIAQTREVGCKPYMAPERIDPAPGNEGPSWDLEPLWGLYGVITTYPNCSF